MITHISFSELATNLVFKIINKEVARNNKYGESLILFLLPNPQNNGYSDGQILKTYATNYLKQKIINDQVDGDEYIISKGKVKGKNFLKVMYMKTDSNLYTDFPQEADFENAEDDLSQAVKFEDGAEINHTYNIRDLIYFNSKYGESAVAKLKDEETLKTVFVYLPKSIMREIKINRKLNKNYYNEKLEFKGVKYDGNIKNYNYKYTYSLVKPFNIDEE